MASLSDPLKFAYGIVFDVVSKAALDTPREQLGLKLEARKSPLGVLVIDYAEKVPIEN